MNSFQFTEHVPSIYGITKCSNRSHDKMKGMKCPRKKRLNHKVRDGLRNKVCLGHKETSSLGDNCLGFRFLLVLRFSEPSHNLMDKPNLSQSNIHVHTLGSID